MTTQPSGSRPNGTSTVEARTEDCPRQRTTHWLRVDCIHQTHCDPPDPRVIAGVVDPVRSTYTRCSPSSQTPSRSDTPPPVFPAPLGGSTTLHTKFVKPQNLSPVFVFHFDVLIYRVSSRSSSPRDGASVSSNKTHAVVGDKLAWWRRRRRQQQLARRSQ